MKATVAILFAGVVLALPTEAAWLDDLDRGARELKDGYYDLAIYYYTRAMDAPELPQKQRRLARAKRGEAFASKGFHERAVKDYDAAIASVQREAQRKKSEGKATSPPAADGGRELAAIYFNRGRANAALGIKVSALADFGEAIALDPAYVGAYAHRGDLRLAEGKFDLALKDYDAAFRLDPSHFGLRFGRGKAYLAKGQYERAVRELDAAITANPENADIHYHRGTAHAEKGDGDSAIGDFTEALGLDPKHFPSRYSRGIVYVAEGLHSQAIEDLGQAIGLRPRHSGARYHRARAHAGKKAYAAAIRDFNEALKLRPNSAVILLGRGKAYAAEGSDGKAVEDFSAAIRLDPDNAEALFHRPTPMSAGDLRQGHRGLQRRHLVGDARRGQTGRRLQRAGSHLRSEIPQGQGCEGRRQGREDRCPGQGGLRPGGEGLRDGDPAGTDQRRGILQSGVAARGRRRPRCRDRGLLDCDRGGSGERGCLYRAGHVASGNGVI